MYLLFFKGCSADDTFIAVTRTTSVSLDQFFYDYYMYLKLIYFF